MEATVRFGKDTWVGSGKPNANHNDANRIKLRDGISYGFLWCKNPVPAGLTVVDATLTLYVAAPSEWTGSKTVKLRKVAERVPFGRLTWNNKPGVSGASQPTATVTSPALGQAVQFDVTQHIQNTAGEPWYGWRIETDSATAHKFFGYESDYAPVLEVTYALSPSQPVDLTPSGGDVSVQFPTFTFDAADLDNPSDMTALQIQIAAPGATMAADGSYATPAFDTGEVAASSPVWDSTGSAWAGIANGGAVGWIARYKSGDGVWGDWSDVYEFGRTDKGTVTITNPAASPNNFVAEATPPILWTFSGTQVSWRVRILDANDPTKIIADSKKQDGTDTSWTVPKQKLKESGSYTVQVRVWDGAERVASPGDPVYAAASRAFTFAHDATVTAPTMVGVEQVGASPLVNVTVTRATAPDSWTLLVDGEVVDSDIDPADTLTTGTTHVIPWVPSPQTEHTFEVRAVVNGKASPKSAAATLTTFPAGGYVIDGDTLDMMQLLDLKVDYAEPDVAGVYRPIRGGVVRVKSADGVPEGRLEGTLVESAGHDLAAAEALVRTLEGKGTCWIVWNDMALEVQIGNVLIWTPPRDGRGRVKAVLFDFWGV